MEVYSPAFRLYPSTSLVHLSLKGDLKAHIHISLYESNALQEPDGVLFHSVIPFSEIFVYCHQLA